MGPERHQNGADAAVCTIGRKWHKSSAQRSPESSGRSQPIVLQPRCPCSRAPEKNQAKKLHMRQVGLSFAEMCACDEVRAVLARYG